MGWTRAKEYDEGADKVLLKAKILASLLDAKIIRLFTGGIVAQRSSTARLPSFNPPGCELGPVRCRFALLTLFPEAVVGGPLRRLDGALKW